ncbi:MAG: HEPN domain-containing protein [Methanoregula sp.]|jgi:HEPN domain-containing protein|nr:HEPN domain-containing protein [Methanoregula sp.]
MTTGDSVEWFRQAQYDLGTAEALFGSERYPPVLFFCHLSLEKALKAHYVEKFNDIPEKTHSLILLVELLELELPQHLIDSLLVINRLGVTGRYPHNLEKMLEQYTQVQTRKILEETKEILTWLMQKSSKR